eukprot:2541851-Karenia_brevis.AAC.1
MASSVTSATSPSCLARGQLSASNASAYLSTSLEKSPTMSTGNSRSACRATRMPLNSSKRTTLFRFGGSSAGESSDCGE